MTKPENLADYADFPEPSLTDGMTPEQLARFKRDRCIEYPNVIIQYAHPARIRASYEYQERRAQELEEELKKNKKKTLYGKVKYYIGKLFEP